MDSLTHLVAGALTPVCFPRAPRRAALIGFGIAAGEFPDIDVFFGGTPEFMLAIHRGITHALLWQPVMALALVLPLYILMIRNRRAPDVAPGLPGFSHALPPAWPCSSEAHGFFRFGGVQGFSLGVLFVVALAALCTHIYLDCMTTFGTQALLPFAQTRVWFSSMFIVDLQLTLPALALLIAAWVQRPVFSDVPAHNTGSGPALSAPFFSPKARRLARLGLAWILLYPLCSLGINSLAANSLARTYAEGDKTRVTLITEAFSPYVWKLVVDDGATYRMGTAFLTAPERAVHFTSYTKADRSLVKELGEQSPLFTYFNEFCPTMVQSQSSAPEAVQASYRSHITQYSFMDLRYVISPDSPARLFGRKDGNFILEARVNESGSLVAYRFLRRGMLTSTPWSELK